MPENPPLLILWDIDHTLVSIKGLSRDIYARAFEQVIGRPMVGQPTPTPAERVAVVILGLRLVPGALRIEVFDHDPNPPQKSEGQTFASESKWGLVLVELLSQRWGTYPARSANDVSGKVVWCEVATS